MYEGEEENSPSTHLHIPHYHGDEVRGLFVLGAILLIVAESTGADLPLTTAGAVVGAAVAVIAAGITNPAQYWIHWVNAALALGGTLLFGYDVVMHYQNGVPPLTASFVFLEGLAIISLIALYLTTRTIRGLLQFPKS